MKNFDVSIYGVEEIGLEATQIIEGGSWWSGVRKIIEILGAADILDQACNGFIDGFKEGYNRNEVDAYSGA